MHPWLAVLSCSVPALAQVTWTVNSAGGAQFTAVQPAIAAAAPGDRIEVPALRHLDVFAQGLAFVGADLVLTGGTATHIL